MSDAAAFVFIVAWSIGVGTGVLFGIFLLGFLLGYRQKFNRMKELHDVIGEADKE